MRKTSARKTTSRTMTGFAATRSPRGIMKQAANDLERGLENTDCRQPDATSQADCPPRPSPAPKNKAPGRTMRARKK